MLAALALRLVKEGTLALDAPLAAVVGNLVPGAEVVTVRMLLTHTAGYPDLYESPEVMASMPPERGADANDSTYDPDRPFTWGMLAGTGTADRLDSNTTLGTSASPRFTPSRHDAPQAAV